MDVSTGAASQQSQSQSQSQSGESPEDIVATTEILRAISDHYTHQQHDGQQNVSEAATEAAASSERQQQRRQQVQEPPRRSPAFPPAMSKAAISTVDEASSLTSSKSAVPKSAALSTAASNVTTGTSTNVLSQTRTEHRTNPYASKLQAYEDGHHATTASSSGDYSNAEIDQQSNQSSRDSLSTAVPPPPELRAAPRTDTSTPGATAVYPNNPLRQYGGNSPSGCASSMEMSGTSVDSNSLESHLSSLTPNSTLGFRPSEASPIIQARLVRESEILYAQNHHHHQSEETDAESGIATHAHSTMTGNSNYENGNSNIAEAVKVVNEDEIIGRRKSFWYLLRDWRVIVVILVLALAIAGLVVGLTVTKDRSEDELDNSPNSTLFLDPADIANNEEIANGLLEELGPDASTPGSPQRFALNWLVNSNILSGMDRFRIIQRFVLASLFFSTGGFTSWLDRTGWLSPDHECTWYQTEYFVNGNEKPVERCNSQGQIQALALEANGLGGTLPDGIHLFTELEYLVLPSNILHSTISSSFNQLSKLTTFDLGFNSLSGSLPELLSPGLKNVTVSDNMLTGSIPGSYGESSALEYLSLSANPLNGTVPDSLAPTSLFDIRNTDITGEIASSLCDSSARVLVNCSNIVCSCCECQ
ncbi:MAG: hypothetical protein SGILL_000069 [Bacillariaceae sp.]